jgi:uncharacterized membrane protein YdbT with pleckstrin-like domain
MEEMRLRPAIHKYAMFWGCLIAVDAAAAIIAGLLSPGYSMPIFAIGGAIAMVMLGKILQRLYLRISTEYVVNDSEINEITGLWAKDENHVPIVKIEDYNIDRSLLGKFLGVASIGIQTARAEHGYEILMQAIPEKDVAALDAALGKLVRPKQ